MSKFDLKSMSRAELQALRAEIDAHDEVLQREAVSKAREEIQAIANSVGIPLKDLMSSLSARQPKAKTTVAVRFRMPDDSSKHWTGRGRQPQWVKDWVDGGKSIDDLRV